GRVEGGLAGAHVGRDLGGTISKWRVLGTDGRRPRVADRGQVPTDASRGEQSVVEQLVALAGDSVHRAGRIASVGVGVPGLYDPVTGATRFIPNVPGTWAGVEVAAQVSAAVVAPAR